MRRTNLMARTTNDGGENGFGSVVASESSLAHASAIVDDQRDHFFDVHLVEVNALDQGREQVEMKSGFGGKVAVELQLVTRQKHNVQTQCASSLKCPSMQSEVFDC